MTFEGWLRDGEEIRHCVPVHDQRETLDGLEFGDYVLRAGLAIEYDTPLRELWNFETWEDTIGEVLNDCRRMRLCLAPRHSVFRRGDKAALCVWEFGDRGSAETAQVRYP